MVILISWVFHTPVGGEKGYKIIISLKYMEILVLDLLVCIKEIKLMNKNETQSITFEKLRNQKFWLGSFSWAAGLGWGFHTPPIFNVPEASSSYSVLFYFLFLFFCILLFSIIYRHDIK